MTARLAALGLCALACGDEAGGLGADGDLGAGDDTPYMIDSGGDPDGDDLDPNEAPGGPDGHAPDECPWQLWNDGLSGGGVGVAAFDPRLPRVVLAGSGSNLQRSIDGGLSFAPWAADLAVKRLAFPGDDPKDILAATGRGLFVSSDSGRTFTPRALGGLEVLALVIHPALGQRVFAGTAGAGIMRSDDGGLTFQALNVGVPRMLVYALAAPSDDPDVALAGGILQNDSLGPGVGGVVLRTDDGGQSWQDLGLDAVWGYDLELCPSDPSRAVAAVRKGAYASRDGGRSWERIAALGTRDVIDLAFAAGGCDRLWASVYRHGVYRVDGEALSGPHDRGLLIELQRFQGSLTPHPLDPEVVLVATHGGLYRSADGGLSWAPLDAAEGLTPIDVAGDGATAWLTTWGGGLWTRASETPWRRVAAMPRDFTWLVAPVGDDLIVGSADDVWVADRAGAVFSLAPGLLNATDAVVLGGARPELLVTTQVAGLQRSQSPRSGWHPSNGGLQPFATSAGTFIDARGLALDPTRPGRVYLALRGAGVAISDDHGARWSLPANELSQDQVIRVVVAADGELHALVSGKGMWRSPDGGLGWEPNNDGLDTLRVMDVALDHPSGRLFVSEALGDIKVSEAGGYFQPIAPWCLPARGWGPLTITEDRDGRWLVATGSQSRVVRLRLGDASE